VLVASLVLVPAGSLVRVFAWSPMRWIGRRSYGIYLYHFPLAGAFVEGRHLQGPQKAVVVTVCVGVSVVLAAASYRWVETPFLRRRHPAGTIPVPGPALQPVGVGTLS
jgi:peptidoglycan/LPS O-acetylase OafA/YrhL